MEALRLVTVFSAILTVYSVVESRRTCYVCSSSDTDRRGECGLSVEEGVTNSEACPEDGAECFVLATWKAGVLTQVMRDCSKPCLSYSDTDSTGTKGTMSCCDTDKCNANFTESLLSTTPTLTVTTTVEPTSGATPRTSGVAEILVLYLLCLSIRKLLS